MGKKTKPLLNIQLDNYMRSKMCIYNTYNIYI